MRTSLAIAAFVAAGGSAAGAGALALLGSDTLFNVTTQAIAACSGASGAGLTYTGTGSGNGENAMIHSTQAIAPMSRFVAGNLCSPVPVAQQQTTNGIVIGLDGVAVLGSLTSAGTAACNGTNTTTCTPEAVGAAFNTTVTTATHGSYTFTSWKDVLAVIYGGQSHSGDADSGCNSDIRNTIASNWGSVFQTGSTCAAASPDACTILQHAFRRDDASGTSDVFAQLLGINPAPSSAVNFNTGASPFCNVNSVGVATATAANPVQITTTNPHGLTSGQTVWVVGVGRNSDGTQITGSNNGNIAADGNFVVTVIDAKNFTVPADGTVAGNGSAVGSVAMVRLPPPPGLLDTPYPTDYMESDPIRRPCAGTATLPKEDVCNRDHNLGLVLAMVPTDNLASVAAQYPTSTCTADAFTAHQPRVINPTNGLVLNSARCPNGDPPHSGSQCVARQDASASTACLNAAGNHPFAYVTTAVNGLTPSQSDGRAQNAHLMAGATVYAADSFSRNIVGAWYRIHSVHVIGSGAATCMQRDATDQIGCLMQASPCSIGFAGKEAASAAGAVAIKVNQVLPLVACIQSFDYALSRKLYLNTIPGFASGSTGTTGENALAQCESQENAAGSWPGIGSILTSNNFVNFPSGGPFAEDFNEPMVCPTQNPPATTPNVVAYTGNAAPIPNTGTICGNGVKEAFEDCDDGTTSSATDVPINGGNGSTTSQCTKTCRWTGNPPAIDVGTCGTCGTQGAACTRTDSTPGKCYTLTAGCTCLP